MAVIIGFNDSVFDHALQDGHGPVFVFAKTPFATGSAADFPARYELVLPRFEKLTNCVLIGVHVVVLFWHQHSGGEESLPYEPTAFDCHKIRSTDHGNPGGLGSPLLLLTRAGP